MHDEIKTRPKRRLSKDTSVLRRKGQSGIGGPICSSGETTLMTVVRQGTRVKLNMSRMWTNVVWEL